MAEYNASNHALNLPDAYKKTKDSNNFKILEIERCQVNDFRQTLQQLSDCLDIDNATGKTLDLYGEMVGQPRGLATDDQYLIMIKARIMRTLSNGCYESIMNAICMTFGCSPSLVYIKESEQPCVVEAVSLPLDIIMRSGLTVSQTNEIVRRMLPVGVRLETSLFEGTFEFAENEGEYDEEAGFNDVENGTMGGYFGALGEDKNETILPI